MKNIILITLASTLLIACSKNEPPKKTDKEVQEDWSKRNTSDKDFSKHESKGF
ncbi:hypothetical protein [Acinetobacter soli]|uniref:hypothetical protein n=1 Tax=Acinetobacter soli TaxID=487316 RepID=UPI003A89D327